VDTRTKILTLETARALPAPLAVAIGYFDVLRASHVRRLQAARGAAPKARLLAVILPLAEEALDQGARARLAAALRVIDYVVIADEQEARALVEALRPAVVARLAEGERRELHELKEHVRGRPAR
jgi:bifunctional ADP-heptose synthase (sugar kinase/adenylyltransferase)